MSTLHESICPPNPVMSAVFLLVSHVRGIFAGQSRPRCLVGQGIPSYLGLSRIHTGLLMTIGAWGHILTQCDRPALRMMGDTHLRTAQASLGLEPEALQAVLRRDWDWLEVGVPLPDHLRAYWDVDILGDEKVLAHRYYVKSQDSKDKGLLGHLVGYSENILPFMTDLREEWIEPEGKDDFYGQLSLFFGILCRYAGDIHTLVHLDPFTPTWCSREQFHSIFEEDMERCTSTVTPKDLADLRDRPIVPSMTRMDEEYLQEYAEGFWERGMPKARTTYARRRTQGERPRREMCSLHQWCFTGAVKMTANLWYTLYVETGMDQWCKNRGKAPSLP